MPIEMDNHFHAMQSSKNSAMPCSGRNLNKKKPGSNTKPSILTLLGI